MKDSLRRRIIVTVLISQLLLAIGLTVAISLYSRAQLLSAFNIMLEGRADSVLAAIHDAEDETKTLVLDRQRLNIPAGDMLEVWDENGSVVWRSPNWNGPPAAVIAGKSPTFELAQGRSVYRGIVVRNTTIFDEEDNQPVPHKVTIIYASSTQELDRHIVKIGLFASIASLILLCLAGVFVAYGVSRGLAPMQELAKEASRVSIQNWSFNPPQEVRTKRELAPLVAALETTLAGLQRAFDRDRESTADAAHELRTAVAILKSSLQLLSFQPRSTEEYKKGLEHALEDCDRLEALVCGTLSLARARQWAEDGKSDGVRHVNLANSCEQSVAELRELAQSRRVELRCLASDEFVVKADPVDLQTVWVNLLHNAIQHSPPESTVSVRVGISGPDTASVVIEDSGTGIPAEHLPHVFERFRRGDPSRSRTTGGFGLGLSICKGIVEAYEGNIAVESVEGTGTRVLVSLPAVTMVPSPK
jgi:signal transduction histidine kinase